MAQDIYAQMDELNTRIAWLTKACKVAGLYDQNTKGSVQRLFAEGQELQLIPVDNWAAFAEKGGVQGSISFIPIEQVANVIAQLRLELNAAKLQLYEVLGISDIMRGMSNPNETLGAQELKAQFGSSRVQFTMSEISEWVAAACRIKAQILAKHCQPDSLLQWSNIMLSTDAPYAQQAVQLLKSENDFRWRVAINPDTMVAIDYAQERDARTQMLQALGNFLQQVAPLIQAVPQAGQFAMQVIKWAMAGFKVGKEIETVLDQLLEAAGQPPPPAPPSPREVAEVRKINAQAAKDETTAAKNVVDSGLALHAQGGAPMPGAPMPGAPMPGAPMPGMPSPVPPVPGASFGG
jgi:hypothetical protein